MEWLSVLIARLRALLRRDAVLEDIEEEMRSHVEFQTETNIERGMTPDAARRAAHRSFGNLGRMRELAYDVRGGGMLETFWHDLRYGARMLIKQPGFTVIAVLTLALGIGANTAIFTLLDRVLIRTLPVEQPEQLVVFVRDGAGASVSCSYPLYRELRDGNDVLSGLAAFFQQPFSMSDGNQTERVIGQIVSGNYFSVLGVKPAIGRVFLPEEDQTPGTHPVVVISHSLWQRRFVGDPGVIGRAINLNGYSYTVVGVVPPEFMGTLRGTVNDVYVPAMMQVEAQPGRNSKLNDPGSGWLRLIGRLNPDVSREQAQAGLSILADGLGQRLGKRDPGATSSSAITLMDGSRGHTDRVSDVLLPLKLLMGVVGFVLLIACANVASLLLARASARRKEMAIRAAIGAGRGRIMRQLLTESMILAALGGGAGLLIASWLTPLLLGFQQPTAFVPRTFEGSVDGRVLGFTIGLSLLTGIIFGLAPALRAAKPDLAAALKEDTPPPVSSLRWLSMRNLLVVSQVALSLLVLIGAGLCVKSLRRLQTIDPGFEPSKVMTASFDLALNGYNESRGRSFLAQLSERAAALPGAESVSLARNVAFSGFFMIRSATIEGYQPQPNERVGFNLEIISPGYFETLGASLVSGRDFTAQDDKGAPLVVIVNEATARRYWPGQEAVGKRLQYGNVNQFAEVVGVVRNIRDKGLTADPPPAIYVPLSQNYTPDMTLHVRTATESQTMLAALRQEVQALDSTLPVYNLMTLAEQKDGMLYTERLAATLLTAFGVLALLLATIGLYGVLSYAVTERTRELGIRTALGARRSDLLILVAGQGMTLTAIGSVVGVAAALALTRMIGNLLFDVSPTDPLTFVMIPLLLGVVSLVACWVPARRATRVDPLIALRYE